MYVCMYVIVMTPGLGCYSSGIRVGVLRLWYQSGDRVLAGVESAGSRILHSYKDIDVSLYFHRIMASQSHNARRVEGSAGSRQSIEVSHAQYEFTPPPAPMTGTPRYGLRCRSKDFKELR